MDELWSLEIMQMDRLGSEQLVSIASQAKPDIAEVGGKATSLIHLSQGGFNVPPGYILKVDFFSEWNRQLAASMQWQQMLDTSPHQLQQFTESCEQLKAFAATLEFSKDQTDAIRKTAENTPQNVTSHATDDGRHFAVRSSAPEEDLADSSFAGLYETVLDVGVDDLPDAIRSCYLSCVDARVLIYKHKLKLAFDAPRIAIVVHELVRSEVAGVAFSLNPINNDYDEAVINAAFGLGEALVSGEITPDSWTVNKISHEVIKFTLGDKGGKHSATASLDDDQIKQLSQITSRIEEYYQQPMDIEWAFYRGELYLLQARPITTYIPITRGMMTQPGEKRILYMDESLADGITISGPVSTITNNYFVYITNLFIQHLDKKLDLNLPPKQNLAFSTDVRIYAIITNLARWGDLSKLAESKRIVDITYGAILESCDLEAYMVEPVSFMQKIKLIPLLAKVVWALRLTFGSALKAIFRAARFHQQYEAKLALFDAFLNEPLPTICRSMISCCTITNPWPKCPRPPRRLRSASMHLGEPGLSTN
jgi:hypothetical protein